MRPAAEHTILVCDDDPDILAALRIYLTGEGYQVVSATDGAEAVRLVAERDVHLVLLDVMMPGLDGIGAAARIRQASNVPIIFLSAKGEEADVAALNGWRRELFGEPALRLIQGEMALRFVNRKVDVVSLPAAAE